MSNKPKPNLWIRLVGLCNHKMVMTLQKQHILFWLGHQIAILRTFSFVAKMINHTFLLQIQLTHIFLLQKWIEHTFFVAKTIYAHFVVITIYAFFCHKKNLRTLFVAKTIYEFFLSRNRFTHFVRKVFALESCHP